MTTEAAAEKRRAKLLDTVKANRLAVVDAVNKAQAVRDKRDAAIRKASDGGCTARAIAVAAGVTPMQISKILNPKKSNPS